MKIWTLMENTACRPELAAEHGLSLYIETGDHKILFDAGQSAAFADNAEKMAVDLTQVDLAVLSHGHYDHSGGLMAFLEINDHAKVYVNRDAFACCYHGEDHFIGVDSAILKTRRIVRVGETMSLAPGLTLHACNEKEKPCPVDSAGLTVLENGVFRPEDFRHEQYLLIEEAGKRILISGCSHKGILNIVHWFRPDVLIGGFHFMNLDPHGAGRVTLDQAAETLLRYTTIYYTGHCTGEGPFAYLKEKMGDRLHDISGGTVLEV